MQWALLQVLDSMHAQLVAHVDGLHSAMVVIVRLMDILVKYCVSTLIAATLMAQV